MKNAFIITLFWAALMCCPTDDASMTVWLAWAAAELAVFYVAYKINFDEKPKKQ